MSQWKGLWRAAFGSLLAVGLLAPGAALANEPPVAADDRVLVRGTAFVLIDVLANDSDADGDPLTATATGGVSVTNLGDGLFQFQPTACLWQPESFTYQVEDGTGSASATVHLIPGGCGDNLQVIALPDVSDTAPDTAVVVDVLANDTDGDGDPLCVDRTVGSLHGTASITPDCLYVWFTPDPGYEGPDAGFRYWAVDGRGGEDDAWVSINVTHAPPTDDYGEDEAVTERGKRLLLSSSFLLSNDAAGATFVDAYSLLGDPVDVIRPPGGEAYVLYQPPAGFEGSRVFKYQAKDADGETFEVDVTITVLPPVGSMRAVDDDLRTVRDGCLTVDLDPLTANDQASGEGISASGIFLQPLVGTLTEVAGSGGRLFTYQPAPGYQGKDVFTYTASDTTADGGGSTDVATVVIDLYDPYAAGARIPVAQIDSAEVDSTAGPVFLEVVANDYDPDCGALTLGSVQHTSGMATVTVTAGNRIRYAPAYGAVGTDPFTYTVRDAQGYRVTGTVTVELTGAIDPPWPRISYRSCASTATCVTDGSDSRRGDGTFYHWGNCSSHWHFEGVNAAAPNGTLPCHPAYHRSALHDMADHYSEAGLVRTELTLADFAGTPPARDVSDRWIPFGGTTTEWTIGHSCVQSTCTFWPVGNWLPGVIGRFQWFFDGLRYSGGELDPDAETFSAEALTHTYASAAAGDTFEVYLVFDVFDRPNGVTESLWITIPPPPPAAPTGLATDNAICEATGPRLTWVDGSHNEEGFIVYRSVNEGPLVEHAVVDADETELQDYYGGPREDLLTYQVAAFNDGGENLSEPVTGRPTPGDCGSGQQAPAAPSLLSAGPPANGVRLTWRDNSALEAGHRLYRSDEGGPFTLVATLGSNRETAFDAPLTPGETYTYRVTAFNAFGESPPTADVSVVVPPFLFADSFESGDTSAWSGSQGALAPPPEGLGEGSLVHLAGPMGQHLLRPSEVRATGYRRSGVELAWRDNSSNEAGFRLLRKERGASYQEIASLPPDSTAYFDEPLEPGKPYRYRVVAFRAVGKQKRSEVARIELPKEIFADSFETRRLAPEWTETDPEGRLALAFGAALFGNRGVAVELGAAPAFLSADAPAEELRLRSRFFLDARQVVADGGVADGAPFATVFRALTEGGGEVFSLRLVKLADGLGLDAVLTTADGSTVSASVADLDGRVHGVEVDWQPQGPSGSGRFRLWLDDRRKVELSGWSAGDLAVGEVRLGAVSAAEGSGSIYFDELLLRRGGNRLRRRGLAGELLREGFEFSALADWEIHARAGGELALVPAPLEGAQALEALTSAPGQKAYAERRLYHPERHLVASFLLDASGMVMAPGTDLRIFEAVSRESGTLLFDLRVEAGTGGLEVKARALDGTGRSRRSLDLPSGPARVEVEWRQTSGPGAADGSLVLRVTEVATGDSRRRTLDGLDTGPERMQILRLGVTRQTDAGVLGRILIDDLETWR